MKQAKPGTGVCTDIEGHKYQVPTTDLAWRPSAYGIVIRDNHILLCKHFGRYNLPGGGLDFGESIEEALKREVKEETGIEIANPRLIAADSDLFKPPYGQKCIQSILLYYACDAAGGSLSMEGFDRHELQYAEMPEWISLDTINNWQITSTKDFRPYVKLVVDKLAITG